MKKSTKNKIKNFILKSITFIALVIFVFCAMCLDSVNNIPFIIGCFVSGIWIFLFCYANNYFDF